MKRAGLGITLALVIALAAILGSTGVVSAARGGNAAVSSVTSVSIENVTDGAFYVSYTLGACPAAGYWISIRDDSANDPHNPYVFCASYAMTSSAKGASFSQVISVAQATPSDAYTVILSLVKNNGDIIECAYGTWVP